MCADSRFAEPRNSLRGNVFCYFLRRAKSNAKTRRGLRPSGLQGRFKALSGILLEILPAARAEPVFRTNGGEKALNRCEVRVLQREDLERRLKEQPCSFADSRLWLGANGWRRAKKSCLGGQYRKVGANRKLFVCRKGWLLRIARQGLCKRKAFCVKRRFLSAVRKFFYKRISF